MVLVLLLVVSAIPRLDLGRWRAAITCKENYQICLFTHLTRIRTFYPNDNSDLVFMRQRSTVDGIIVGGAQHVTWF